MANSIFKTFLCKVPVVGGNDLEVFAGPEKKDTSLLQDALASYITEGYLVKGISTTFILNNQMTVVVWMEK